MRVTTLERIRRSGVLRVSFHSGVIPFSYLNKEGRAVGFDIAFMNKLARHLGVDLKLIPFTWKGLEQDVVSGRSDIAVGGIYVTGDRLQHLSVTRYYHESSIALIVPAKRAQDFLSRDKIRTIKNLEIAVLDDPIMIELAKRHFPDAKFKVVPVFDDLSKYPDVDAAMWTADEARAWAATHAGYTAVVPRGVGGVILFAYLLQKEADEFRRFVEYWLSLQTANGFHQRMVSYFLEGKPERTKEPRWSLLGHFLGVK